MILKLRYGPKHGSLIALVVRGVSVSCRKNRLRLRDYWNMERGRGDPEAKAKHGSLIASVIRGVSVHLTTSCRKPLGTEGLFVG